MYCGYPEKSKYYALQLLQLQNQPQLWNGYFSPSNSQNQITPKIKVVLGLKPKFPKNTKYYSLSFPLRLDLTLTSACAVPHHRLPPPPSHVALIISLPLPHHLPTAPPPVSVASIESQPQHVPPSFRSPEGPFLMDQAVPTMILAMSDCQQWWKKGSSRLRSQITKLTIFHLRCHASRN